MGKAIDPADHTEAGLAALEGSVSERTRWLIERHMDALAYRNRTLSKEERTELEGSEHFDDLLELRDCDDAGRDVGVEVDTLDDVLRYLRSLADESYLDGLV